MSELMAMKGVLPKLGLLSFTTYVVCVAAAFTQIISFDLMMDLNSFPSKLCTWAFPVFVAGECSSMGLSICLLDRYGRRMPYLIGSIMFITASVFCALCSDMMPFLIARFVQGFGTGLVIVACIAQIYFDVQDKKQRYLANGILSLGFGVGMLCGIFGGKAAFETIGWPAAFLMMAAVQAIVTYPSFQALSNGMSSERRADIVGGIVLAVWAAAFVLLLQQMYLHWSLDTPQAWMGISFVVLLFLVFVILEIHNPHSVFHRKVDSGKLITGFMIFIVLLGLIDMASVGYMVKIALFTYEMSVLEAAPYFIVMVGGAAITAITISNTIDRTGHLPWLILSAVLSPIALISITLVKPEDPTFMLGVHLFILGLAMGCLVSMLNAAIQNRTNHHNNGAVMSMAIMMRTVALWLGFNFYQFVTDGYMEGKIGGIVSHWNEILPVEIPSNTGLANMLITPLGDLIRLLPGITDDIAVYFAEGVGQALVIGSISFVAVAVPVALLLVGREKAL